MKTNLASSFFFSFSFLNGDSWFSYLTSLASKPQKGHTQCPGRILAYLLANILAVRRYRGWPRLQAEVLPSDVKHWGIRVYRGKVWEQLRSEEFPITLSKQELEFLNCSSYFTAEARGYKSKKAPSRAAQHHFPDAHRRKRRPTVKVGSRSTRSDASEGKQL